MCLKKLLYNSDKYVLTGVKKPCMHLIVLLFSFYFQVWSLYADLQVVILQDLEIKTYLK